VTKVKEFCLFYFYKKDGLPGHSQKRSLEHSDTKTLGILGTLAHFSHFLRFTQAKPIISDHAHRRSRYTGKNAVLKNEKRGNCLWILQL